MTPKIDAATHGEMIEADKSRLSLKAISMINITVAGAMVSA